MRKLAFFVCLIISNWASAQSNYALNFDGVDDYVSTNLSVSNYTAFTVEAWINYSSSANTTAILGQNGVLEISFNNSRLYVWMQSHNNGWVNTYYAIDAAFPANTWNHFAITGDGSSLKIYINGVQKASLATSWDYLYSNANKFNMAGFTQNPFVYFNGKMDEVRVWNTARTQAQIKANMFNKNLSNSASGLTAYYKMNEGSGTTAANSSTNTSGIDGIVTNGPTWTASPIQFGGNALHFDQADDRVIAPLATTATSNVTMELWISHEGGTGTDHLLISNGVMGTNGYAMYINTQRKLCVQFNAVGVWNTNYVFTPNVWTHIALVINTTGFIVYINGANVYSNTATPVTPTGSFILGFNTVAGGQPFDGKMDEVRVWNAARTQTEIQNNMNGEIDPSTSGLALYYTFNQGIAAGDNTGLTSVIDQTSNGYNGTLTNFALSGSTSNYLSQNSNLFILPLQWLSFTATKQNNNVLLQWSTAQEQNTKDFIVQHSPDGRSWTNVATNPATGNSSSITNYSYLHTVPVNGMNYYRILQTDLDGRFSYSPIRSVKFDANGRAVEVMSNPVVNGLLQIKISTSNSTPVSLHSGNGKLLWSRQFTPGIHSIDVSRYSKGIYFLNTGEEMNKILLQ